MRIVAIPAPKLLGVPFGADKVELRFNKQEMATILRAYRIIDEARDKLRGHMGAEFDASDLYTLSVEDVAVDHFGGAVQISEEWN